MTYSYGKDNVQKNTYEVWMIESTNGSAFGGEIANVGMNAASDPGDISAGWVRLGVLSENPSLITSEGDTVALNDATELVLSESAELSAEILEVTHDNWNEIRTVHNEEVDVIFSVSSTTAGSTAIGVTEIRLKANLEITGNDMNKITLAGTVEPGDVANKMGFVKLT